MLLIKLDCIIIGCLGFKYNGPCLHLARPLLYERHQLAADPFLLLCRVDMNIHNPYYIVPFFMIEANNTDFLVLTSVT